MSAERAPVAAIFDLDGTVTRFGTFTPFVVFVARRRPGKFIHALPIALCALAYQLRLLSRSRLKEIMLGAVLSARPRAEIEAIAQAFTAWCLQRLVREAAVQRIACHRRRGDLLILATASFDIYAERLGHELGFEHVIATQAHWRADDAISGKIRGVNCRGPEKLKAIERALPDLKARFRVVAYSDHHADLPLLRWADTGFAVSPTRRLRSAAQREGFEILDWNAGRRRGAVPNVRKD